MSKLDGMSGAEVPAIPTARKGHGELVFISEVVLDDFQYPTGLGAVHCTADSLWADGRRIA